MLVLRRLLRLILSDEQVERLFPFMPDDQLAECGAGAITNGLGATPLIPDIQLDVTSRLVTY
jgi:hypothetical protein